MELRLDEVRHAAAARARARAPESRRRGAESDTAEPVRSPLSALAPSGLGSGETVTRMPHPLTNSDLSLPLSLRF